MIATRGVGLSARQQRGVVRQKARESRHPTRPDAHAIMRQGLANNPTTLHVVETTWPSATVPSRL